MRLVQISSTQTSLKIRNLPLRFTLEKKWQKVNSQPPSTHILYVDSECCLYKVDNSRNRQKSFRLGTILTCFFV